MFSNDKTTINVAISTTENRMKDSQIKAYKEYMEKLLKDYSENILETNYYNVDKMNLKC